MKRILLREKTQKTADGRLILYHGSDREFKKFDVDQAGGLGRGEGKYADDGFFGRGIYFTPRRNWATKYGKHVYTCAVDIKNPCFYYGHWVDILKEVFPEEYESFKRRALSKKFSNGEPKLSREIQEQEKNWGNQTLDTGNCNFVRDGFGKINKKYGTKRINQWYKRKGYDGFIFTFYKDWDFLDTKANNYLDRGLLSTSEIGVLNSSQVEILKIGRKEIEQF